MADSAPLYVAARAVLLDALESLGSQRDAVIVVGAQAIYMRIGSMDIGIAPFTMDADWRSPQRIWRTSLSSKT